MQANLETDVTWEGGLWGMVGLYNPATWYWMNCKLVSRLATETKVQKKKKKETDVTIYLLT
jgi:hypothetical protein